LSVVEAKYRTGAVQAYRAAAAQPRPAWVLGLARSNCHCLSIILIL
jgi:hypothetical protein